MKSLIIRASHHSPNHAGRRAIVALALAAMIGWLNGAALSPFLPDIAQDLDTTIPRLGQITTILFILGAGVSLVVGPVADARGSRRLMLAGLLAVVTGSLGTAVAPDYWTLLVTRLVGAFSAGTLSGIALAVAATLFSQSDQRRAISWVAAGIAGGAVVGIPLLTAIGSLLGWRVAFVMLAGLALLVAGLLRSATPDDAKHHSIRLRAGLESYAPLVRSAGMRALYGASALRSIGWMGYLVYAGAFFQAEHGLSTQEIGWTYVVGGLAFFLGTILAGGRMGGRPLRSVFAAASLVTGGCVGLALAPPVGVVLAIVLISLAALTLGISNVAMSALLTTETPAGRGTTMSLNSAILELGTAGGGAIGGVLIAFGGYTALGVGLPMFLCLSALLVSWKPRAAVQRTAASSASG